MSPESQQPDQPDQPRRIGPYDIVGVLGAGGMGRVYLGRAEDGREVAVKVVHADLARDPEFRRRLGREAEATRKVAGPHIAAVVDADIKAEQPWLATEYVPAPSLWEVVCKDGPLSLEAVRELGTALAGALASVHDAGLVHRDVKPPNILMAEAGPKLIDFGIARDSAASTMTRTGFVLGTPQAMAPEQIRGRRDQVGPAADVFALGGVMCFAATGRFPFGDGDPTALSYRIVHTEPDLDGAPAALRPLLARCLAKEPEERPSAAEVVDALTSGPADVATHQTESPQAEEPTPPPPEQEDEPTVAVVDTRPPRKARRRLAAVGAGVVVLSVGTIIALVDSSAGGAAPPSNTRAGGATAGAAVGGLTSSQTLTPTPAGMPASTATGPLTATSASKGAGGSVPTSQAGIVVTTDISAGPPNSGSSTPPQTTHSTTAPQPPASSPAKPPPTTPGCATTTAPCRAAAQDGSAKTVHSNYQGSDQCLMIGQDLSGNPAGAPGACSGTGAAWRVWRGTTPGTLQLEHSDAGPLPVRRRPLRRRGHRGLQPDGPGAVVHDVRRRLGRVEGLHQLRKLPECRRRLRGLGRRHGTVRQHERMADRVDRATRRSLDRRHPTPPGEGDDADFAPPDMAFGSIAAADPADRRAFRIPGPRGGSRPPGSYDGDNPDRVTPGNTTDTVQTCRDSPY